MGEHGVNLENMEKTENINQTTSHTIYDSKRPISSTDYSNHSILWGFIAMVEKIVTYALEEHGPGSAQDWRASSDL